MKYFEHYHAMLNANDFKKFNDSDNIWAVEQAVNNTNGCSIVTDDEYNIPVGAYTDGDYVIEYDVYNHVYYVDVYYLIADDDRIKELNN